MSASSLRVGTDSHPRLPGGRRIPAALLLMAVLVSATLASAADPPLVVMETSTRQGVLDKHILVQEVLRQGFLLAAREDFGARTRDEWLREPLEPGAPRRNVVRFIIGSEAPGQVTLILRRGTGAEAGQKAFAPQLKKFATAPETFVEEAVKQSTDWIAGDYRALLTGFGLTPAPAVPKPTVALDAEPVGLDFLSLLSSIRKLHLHLRHDPQSILLLTRIAREYALLGSVCEIHWGTEHKSFKARALLYAARAHRLAPRNPEVLWSRAFAWALAGLPRTALEALNEVQALPKPEAPAWGPALTAFVRWDAAALAQEAETLSPIASYFALLAAEIAGTDEERLRAANQVVQVAPECSRALSVVAWEPSVGLRRRLGDAQLDSFLRSVPKALAAWPDLPAEVAAAVKEANESDAGSGEDELLARRHEAISRHAALLAALRSGASTAAEGKEVAEPSLSVTATLLENMSFLNALQIVTTERQWLSVDTGESIVALEPLLAQHPAKGFLRAYQSDSLQAQAALIESLDKLVQTPPSNTALGPLESLAWLRAPAHPGRLEDIRAQRDYVLPDLLLSIQEQPTDAKRTPMLAPLRALSPDCPAVVAATIRYDWKAAAPQAREWETRYPSLLVLQALAEQYEAHESDSADYGPAAARCLQRVTELQPTIDTYRALARYYGRHNDSGRWKEILVAALELPSYGLEEASIARDLADWHMGREEWTDAQPFALRAAASYSAWGLSCAARCYEGLQEWDKAEEMVRRVAERYDDSRSDWYFWCRRTGHGDAEAAAELYETYLADLPEKQREIERAAAVFYELRGNVEAALAVHLQRGTPGDVSEYSAFSAIVLLDGLGRHEERDRLVQLVLAQDRDHVYTTLCEQLARPADAARPGLTDLELRFSHSLDLDSGAPTNAAWFIGKLLLQRKRTEEGIEWLKQAASSPTTSRWTCTLATAELNRLGIPIPPRRKRELAPELANAEGKLDLLVERWRADSLPAAGEAARELLKIAPTWPRAWLTSADFSASQNRVEEALARYTELLRLVPDNPWILSRRGRAATRAGRWSEAVADYEAALAISPELPEAHAAMAWVRSSATEAPFRDGAAALKHVESMLRAGHDPYDRGTVVKSAALAETGDFDGAAKLVTDALRRRKYSNRDGLNEMLKLYRAKQPFRLKLTAVPE